jgi:pimeloyl-ACP methyl ester carboxylesterase
MLIRANPLVPRRGLILFAHEFRSDMHSCARYCYPFQQAGYDVFTFDFRGHGQSANTPDYEPRQWVSNREIDDVRGAAAYLGNWLQRHGYPRRIGVFGISRGACAAILAALENPDIRVIVSDGAFSTDRTIEYFMKRWAYIFAKVRILYENHHPAFWKFLRWCMMFFARREFGCTFPSVRKAIQHMTPRPMLFIHGEKDSYLPVEQTRLLYALAPQPKQLWIASGARHNQAVTLHPELYARLTVGFFDRYLARLQPEPVTMPAGGNGTPRAVKRSAVSMPSSQ